MFSLSWGRLLLNWLRIPDLQPDVIAELERHGVAEMRKFLEAQDRFGTNPDDTLYRIGYVIVRRGEIEEWLKWKKELGRFRASIVTVGATVLRLLMLVP
jgi:hypothetical protein